MSKIPISQIVSINPATSGAGGGTGSFNPGGGVSDAALAARKSAAAAEESAKAAAGSAQAAQTAQTSATVDAQRAETAAQLADMAANEASVEATSAADSAAQAAQVLVDAVKYPELSAPAGSELVGFMQSGSGAVARTVEDKARERLNPRDFGAVCDGSTDDTEAVRAMHAYANSSEVAIIYDGVDRIAIQANARIAVNSSVDFAGCEIVILDGFKPTPSFSDFNIMFMVEDPATPVQSVTGATSTDSLKKGSFYPTKGIFETHGYAELSAPYKVPNRAETGVVDYVQAFKIHRNARVSCPLSVDLSAFNGSLTVRFRPTSKKQLILAGATLVESNWNNQILFEIRRCNVVVRQLTLLYDNPAAYDNIDNIVHVTRASDIWVDRFLTTARPVNSGNGSYCFGADGAADVYIDGMQGLSGWGATGCNNINGLYVTRSHVNRVDCHESAHNIFVSNSDLTLSGISYGWGGGVLSVKNCRLWNSPAITARADYGGSFFGAFVVDSVECAADPDGPNAFNVIVALNSGVALGASTPVFAPDVIRVSNVTQVGRSPNPATFEIIPVAIQVKDAASVVYAPSLVEVRGVACFTPWMIGMRLDVQNLERNPSGLPTKLRISDCTPTLQASGLTVGVIDYDSIRTQTLVPGLQMRVDNVDNISVRMRNASGLDVEMNRCGVNALRCNTSTSQPTIVYRGCKFLNAAPGSGPNFPIGGGVSAPTGYTVLSDCEFSAETWNLQFVSALQGILIRSGGASPLLPTDVTKDQAFTGWRRSAVFPS